MNSKHKRILQAIRASPSSGAIEWNETESADCCRRCSQGRTRFSRPLHFGNEIITFRRPHPEKDAKPYQVKDAGNFLKATGVAP